MLIWKQKLPEDTLEIIKAKLPFGTVEEVKNSVLKVDNQYGDPVMWFQADNDKDHKVHKRKEYLIHAIGTGHNYVDADWGTIYNRDSYLGTVALYDDSLVLHYFISTEKDYEEVMEAILPKANRDE